MTMGMIAISCILMKTLLCSYGLSMMDELGQYALGFSAECGQAMHDEEAEHFRAEFFRRACGDKDLLLPQ